MEDQALSVEDPENGVLGNDTSQTPLRASVVASPSKGDLTLNSDGTFEYVPAPDSNGTDQFLYEATDRTGDTDTATVEIAIEAVNDPPEVTTNDVLTVESRGETEPITSAELRAEDPDDAASALEYTVTDGPSEGRILIDGEEESSFTQRQIEDGVVEYDHTGEAEDDAFTFDLTDDDGAGPTGRTFEIVIGLDNDPPDADDDEATTTEDEDLTVSDSSEGVLANDTDPDDDPLSVSAVNGVSENVGTQITLSSGARLTLNENGTYTYDPNGAFEDLAADDSETESFSYTAADGRGGTDQATVTMTITGVNDAPVLETVDGLAVTVGGEEDITTLALDATDPDDAASALEYAVTDGPSQGRILVEGEEESSFTQQQVEDGSVTYDHTAETADDDQFTFDLTDDDGAGPTGQTFTIAVEERNAPPTARDTTIVTSEDTAATGSAPGILGNDSDPDGDVLSVAAVNGGTGRNIGAEITLASGALLTVRGNGSYVYDPNGQFESLGEEETASETVSYTASDGNGGTDQATVTFRIEGKNEPPTVSLSAPAEGTIVKQGEPVRIRAGAQDPDGTVQAVTFRAGGSVVGRDEDAADGFAVDWTPARPGSVELTAEATDEDGASAPSDPVSVRVRSARVGLSVRRSFPNPTQQSSFRLVALPGQTSRSLASTLSSQSPEDWRAFREMGATGSRAYSREPCGETGCSFRPGGGFWLIAREAWSVEDSVEAVPLQTDDSRPGPVRRVPLQDGWNIVSNPLETDVSWDAVQAVSGTNEFLWRWDGRWTQAQTFSSAASGEAYYFRDDTLDSLTVPFGGTGTASALATETSDTVHSSDDDTAPAASQLSLSVKAAGDTVSTVVAGVRPGAKVALDRTDRNGPPEYFGAASLRLIETTSDRRHALAAEYKPTGREGYAYDVRLRASTDTSVTLVASGLGAFPQARISLVRRPTGREHELRAGSTLTVVPREQTTRFRLLIGSDAYVAEKTRDIAPAEVKLLPNYPNPFRRATTLEYALSERQHVRLVIYDVMGRRLRVLVDEVQRAGFHQVRWPGRADTRPVASGVYFARLNAETTTKVERLVVLR